MDTLSWLSIPAILLTFIFVFVPVFLWLVDALFSRVLEQKLFAPNWNKYGIGGAILFWVLEWVY